LENEDSRCFVKTSRGVENASRIRRQVPGEPRFPES
jgi:hypothetical protein